VVNFIKIYKDILYVSKKTGTNKKKIIIIFSVLLSNLTAASDIAIIVIFSKFFAQSSTYELKLELIISYIIESSYLLPALIIARFVFVYFQSYILKVLELRVQTNLKSYLLEEVFDKSNYSMADAYFYINTLTGHIGYFYSALASFLNYFLQTCAYLIFLIYSDNKTVVTFGIGLILLFFPSKYFLTKARKFMHKSYVMDQKSNFEIQNIIENMFVIKILNKTSEELKKFAETLENYKLNQIKNHIFGSFTSFLPSFVTLFIFSVLMTTFNLAKSISLDFIAVTLRLFQTLGGATTAINKIVNSHVHIEQFYLIDNNKFLAKKENYSYSSKKSKYSISVENVNFKYFNSENYIFKNLNLDIQKNSHNVIVGSNGSGKSTLLGLIAGVLYPESGNIISFERTYGYIGPTPLIFNDSLKNNLIYGNKNKINENKLIKICEEFDLFTDLNEDNLNLNINNKNLSSGQMQKISFIRAILLNPRVLLLDEATSNLDTLSKEKVFDILKENDITIINCTHDPSSFKSVNNYFKIYIEEKERTIKIL